MKRTTATKKTGPIHDPWSMRNISRVTVEQIHNDIKIPFFFLILLMKLSPDKNRIHCFINYNSSETYNKIIWKNCTKKQKQSQKYRTKLSCNVNRILIMGMGWFKTLNWKTERERNRNKIRNNFNQIQTQFIVCFKANQIRNVMKKY